MAVGDLCWTRRDGLYYLGRVQGDWRPGNAAEADVRDLGFLRPCLWRKPGLLDDAVPGKIVNYFISGRTIQRFADDFAGRYSAGLWDRSLEPVDVRDVFRVVAPEDVEDIVILYLQVTENYRVLASSIHHGPTMAYEAVLRRSGDPGGAGCGAGVCLCRRGARNPARRGTKFSLVLCAHALSVGYA